jgi:hypothetical protein
MLLRRHCRLSPEIAPPSIWHHVQTFGDIKKAHNNTAILAVDNWKVSEIIGSFAKRTSKMSREVTCWGDYGSVFNRLILLVLPSNWLGLGENLGRSLGLALENKLGHELELAWPGTG